MKVNQNPDIDYDSYNSAYTFQYRPDWFITTFADKNGEYVKIHSNKYLCHSIYTKSIHAAKCRITRMNKLINK